MKGLGNQVIPANMIGSLLLKAQEASDSFRGKSSLPARGDVSTLEESAVVHYVQLDHGIFGNKDGMSDDGPAVVRTVERLFVVEHDALDTKTGEGNQVRMRDSILMSADNAPANSGLRFGRWRHWQGKGGTQKLQSHNQEDDSVTKSRSDLSSGNTGA
ncbi:MAG: hypothetical protein AM326_02925 [Candidatus Thorarchaeota archaeon SMTZ-45]|nr:MAG: hypothetical protein AM326_02925 [Candidatus Thorarchaeota archaeon SMTZ-45]